MGQAYGFFDCRGSKKVIQAELPTIRELVQTPSELELSLNRNVGNMMKLKGLIAIVTRPSQLKGIAKKVVNGDLGPINDALHIMRAKYRIKSVCPNATDEGVADETAAVLNQAYQSPLYIDNERFSGEIVYQDPNGEYVFMD